MRPEATRMICGFMVMGSWQGAKEGPSDWQDWLIHGCRATSRNLFRSSGLCLGRETMSIPDGTPRHVSMGMTSKQAARQLARLACFSGTGSSYSPSSRSSGTASESLLGCWSSTSVKHISSHGALALDGRPWACRRKILSPVRLVVLRPRLGRGWSTALWIPGTTRG